MLGSRRKKPNSKVIFLIRTGSKLLLLVALMFWFPDMWNTYSINVNTGLGTFPTNQGFFQLAMMLRSVHLPNDRKTERLLNASTKKPRTFLGNVVISAHFIHMKTS